MSQEISLNLTVKKKQTIGKCKQAISSFAYHFWNCSSFVYGICLENSPYFKKYFCTDDLLLNAPDVFRIHSKAFYCLGQTLNVFEQVLYQSRHGYPPCGIGRITILVTKLLKIHSIEEYLNKKIEQSEYKQWLLKSRN